MVDTFSPALPDKFVAYARRVRIIGIVLLIFNMLNNVYRGNFFAAKTVFGQLFYMGENTV